MITIFYDGKCNLCLGEINYYRSIDTKKQFIWDDITIQNNAFKQLNISLVDGLKKLHALDATGTLYTGVDAFILIWRQFKYWRILAAVVSLPVVYPLSKIIYHYFAAYRFKRLKHCQLILNGKDDTGS